MIIVKGLYDKVDMWMLDYELIKQLWELNKTLEADIYICIHCGIEGIHSPTGFHPKGMAVDMHFEKHGEVIQPVAMIKFLLSKWRGGIGVYTHWRSAGFHLDVGPIRTWWKKDNTGTNYKIGEFLAEAGLDKIIA